MNDLNNIPENERVALFWDTKFENIDLKKNKIYIIKRILEFGDTGSAKWMFKTYPKNEIIDVLKTSREISDKSVNYWNLLFFGIKR